MIEVDSINAEASVDDVIARFPTTARVFIRRRMACVGCEIARFESIAEACANYRQPLGLLLAELRDVALARDDIPLRRADRASLRQHKDIRPRKEQNPPRPSAIRSRSQRRISMEPTHTTNAGQTGEAQILDVRQLRPAQRHGLIFETFAKLLPGAAFVLVNDHDPKPLYYQFNAEHADEFTWDYQEQGPQTWRVRIGKTG